MIDSSVAEAIANVFVNASGRNIRPSCASSRNTGTNDRMMIASEKKIGTADLLAPPRSTAARLLLVGMAPSPAARPASR